MKQFTISILILLIIPAAALAIPRAAMKDRLKVVRITRISHPAFRAGNLWYGVRDPWNRDLSRIMLYENTHFTDPRTGKTGRGLVWGFVRELKRWKTLVEYEAAARPVPYNSNWQANSVYWSPFTGEDNVIYGLYLKDKTIRRLNVDTGEMDVIASYDPGDGIDVGSAFALGFDENKRFVINFSGTRMYSGGLRIDVRTRKAWRYTEIPERCDKGGDRMLQPVWRSGHDAASPNGKWWVRDAGPHIELLERKTCKSVALSQKSISPRTLSHFSWYSDTNWFVVDDRGGLKEYRNEPTIDEFRVYLMWRDGSIEKLFSTRSAQYWYDLNNNARMIGEFSARPLPTLRRDGRQILFTSTDGKYVYEDYKMRGAVPWGNEGFFLADLTEEKKDQRK